MQRTRAPWPVIILLLFLPVFAGACGLLFAHGPDAVASVSDSGLVIARATGKVVIAANADTVIGTASVVVEDTHVR